MVRDNHMEFWQSPKAHKNAKLWPRVSPSRDFWAHRLVKVGLSYYMEGKHRQGASLTEGVCSRGLLLGGVRWPSASGG